MYQYHSAASRKKICISFDWHIDRHYRHLLSAWIENPKFPVDFEDLTPGAINTDDVGVVKGVLTRKIRASTHILVLVGEHANSLHKDWMKIGERNWIWWEIQQAKAEGKGLIAVKLESTNPTPDPLYGSGAKWAMKFEEDAILKALNEA